MKVFNLVPGGGKTTALVKIMLEPGNEDVIYVAPTLSQAIAAHRLAVDLANSRYCPTVPEFARFLKVSDHKGAFRGKRVVADEAQYTLQYLEEADVIAIALTDEGKKAAFRAGLATIDNLDVKAQHLRDLVSQAARREEELNEVSHDPDNPFGGYDENWGLRRLLDLLKTSDALFVLDHILNGDAK